MKKLLLFVLMVIAISVPLFAQGTHIPAGNVSGTWTRAGSPYYIDGNITVPQSMTLSILYGARVVFTGYYSMTVEGNLIALGGISKTIFQASPGLTWKGIYFHNAADNSIIKYAKIENVRDATVFKVENTDNLTVSDCEITNNNVHDNVQLIRGVVLDISASSYFSFVNNTIRENNGNGNTSLLYFEVCDNLTIQHNTVIYNLLFYYAHDGLDIAMIYLRYCTGIIFNENNILSNKVYFPTNHGIDYKPLFLVHRCDYAQIADNEFYNNMASEIVYIYNTNSHLSGSINVTGNLIHTNIGMSTGHPANSIVSALHDDANMAPQTRTPGFINIDSNTITRNTLSGPSSNSYVFLSGGKISLTNNIISDNRGSTFGGGVFAITENDEMIITDNTISYNYAVFGGGAMLRSSDYSSSAIFSNNYIFHNTATNGGGGIYVFSPSTTTPIDISHNTIYQNISNKGGGIYVVNNSSSMIDDFSDFDNRPVFTQNIIAHNSAYYGAGIYVADDDVKFVNNIIAYNYGFDISLSYGIFLAREYTHNRVVRSVLINNIIWNNATDQIYGHLNRGDDVLYIRNSTIVRTVNYWRFEGIVDALNVYTADPEFVDPHGYDWHIQNEDYDTIYTGFSNPYADYVGVLPYDGVHTSPDHNRAFTADLQWISFPILSRNTDTNGDVPFLDVASTFLDKASNFIGQNGTSSYSDNSLDWLPILSPVTSTMGYKVQVTESFVHSIQGTTINPNTPITLLPNIDNWVGYFLPETQYARDVFDTDTRSRIAYILTKNGAIHYISPFPPYAPNIWEPTLSFGEMAIIRLRPNQTSHTFTWSRGQGAPPSVRQPTNHYAFTQRADYQSLYIEYVADAPPTEIGALINGVCKGATVYQGTTSEILLYLDVADFDEEIVIEFAYLKNGSYTTRTIDKFTVVNLINGKHEYIPLIASADIPYYHIEIASGKSSKSDIIVPPFTQLLQNYPNPFNPDTKIDFYLSHDDHVTLSVYNIKGQKVCDLVRGSTSAGKHSVVWNGKDSMGRSVSSGVYLYKLTTGLGSVQRKMVLLK